MSAVIVGDAFHGNKQDYAHPTLKKWGPHEYEDTTGDGIAGLAFQLRFDHPRYVSNTYF
jgi:hypothetical protein